METNEKSMTPEESIQIIRKSILNSRKNLKGKRFLLFILGVVTGFCQPDKLFFNKIFAFQENV